MHCVFIVSMLAARLFNRFPCQKISKAKFWSYQPSVKNLLFPTEIKYQLSSPAFQECHQMAPRYFPSLVSFIRIVCVSKMNQVTCCSHFLFAWNASFTPTLLFQEYFKCSFFHETLSRSRLDEMSPSSNLWWWSFETWDASLFCLGL